MEFATVILVVLASYGCGASQLCRDKIYSCSSYANACSTTGPLLKWVKTYCPQYCGVCHLLEATTTTSAPTTIQKDQRSTYDNRKNNFCYYGGKEYVEGEKWQDGCDYNCTCGDGVKGHYTCISPCSGITIPKEYPSNCETRWVGCCTRLFCRVNVNGTDTYVPFEQIPTAVTPTVPPTPSPRPCRNVLHNCNSFPYACTDEPGIRKWARQYCAHHCGLCTVQ